VLIDECHIVKAESGVTTQIKKLKTNNIVGYTGTVPLASEDDVNRWSVLGIIGKVICKTSSTELREKGYKSKAKIVAVNLKGCKHKPKFKEWIKVEVDGEMVKELVERDKGLVYKEEEEYLLKSQNRNLYVKKLIDKVCNGNTLIPIDWNYHEDLLREVYKDSDRVVYFLNGESTPEERKRIYKKLETDTNSLLFVKTGIMREGISIKNLSHMVSFFAKKSYIRILQLLGRIERLGGNKVPIFWDIYDDSRKSKQHFEAREEIYNRDNIPVIKKEVKLDY